MRVSIIALVVVGLIGCESTRPYGPSDPVEPIDTVVVDTVAADTTEACTATPVRTTWLKRDYCPPNGRPEPNVDTIDGKCYERRFTYCHTNADTVYHPEILMDRLEARAQARAYAPLFHFRGDTLEIAKTLYCYLRGYSDGVVRIKHKLPAWPRYYPYALLSYDSCGAPINLHLVDRSWDPAWDEWVGFPVY